MEECCTELQTLLNQVLKEIKDEKIELRRYITISLRAQTQDIKSFFDILYEYLKQSFTEVATQISNVKENVSRELRERLEALFRQLKEQFDLLTSKVENGVNEILRSLTVKFEALEGSLAGIEATLGGVKTTVLGVEATVGGIATALAALGTELNTLIGAEHFRTHSVINSSISSITRSLNSAQIQINFIQDTNYKDLKKTLTESTESITKSIEEAKKEILKSLDERKYQLK